MIKATSDSIVVHPSVVDKIREHSQQQAAKGNYEAVGVVAAKFNRDYGVAVVPLHNHAPDPHHTFFVEPWEQYRVENKLEQRGMEILGVYHSHVGSEALPSASDHAMARPGEYVFIYSVIFDEIRAYKEDDGVLIPCELLQEAN